MNHWVMDYETLYDCFTAVFEHYKTKETKVFVISRLRNDQSEFLSFLKQNINKKEWHISYNGLAFDAQVTHYILDNVDSWKDQEGLDLDGHLTANIIYKFAQRTITKSNNREFADYPEWKMQIGQIDLFKMHHWDNPAKRSSLKWIQYSMDWDNILDMPIHHGSEIRSQEELNTVLEYNINDVKSTKEIFSRSTELIKLRKELTTTYDINLFSASEPRISKELFAYYMSDKLNINKRDLKKMRTFRKSIKFKDIILDYIKFESPEFKGLLERFKAVELNPDNLKGAFKYSLDYKGVKTHFGVGGVHGARKSGIYESDDDNIIMSSDVTSFYPNLVIRNKWAPGHFPVDEFCNQYEWFFEERKKIPKSNPITNLQLEHDEYQKLVLGDVNNYIGLNNWKQVDMSIWRDVKAKNPHYKYKVDGDKFFFAPAKMKGRYDFFNLALHKNKSKLIIPKAVYNYFIHDILPEIYLNSNKNILDYCIGSKSKGDWKQVARNIKDGAFHEEELQKINRYYISNNGVKIIKVNKTDAREIQLEAGKWIQKVFNNMKIETAWDKYDINKGYYLTAIEQEINNILEVPSNQLTLF